MISLNFFENHFTLINKEEKIFKCLKSSLYNNPLLYFVFST